uniref:Tetraspanin family protein n=1 Tax=Entamoeba histolytica TaxID=5759 RepID=A0A060N262_ENTHI|nr:hypothetical protein [Entamoeba histolytica]
MEKQRIYNLSLLVLEVVVVLASTALIFLTIFGPIRKMPNTNKLNSSDLKFYSKTVFMLIMISLAVLFMVAGGMMIATSFVQKDWMCLLSYIVIGLGVMCAFSFGVYFAVTYGSFVKTTNTSLKTLAHWEDIFDCCGWNEYRSMPPCASASGSTSRITCKTVTQPIAGASLQNLIVGFSFFLLLVVGIIFIYLIGGSLNSNAGYNKLDQ